MKDEKEKAGASERTNPPDAHVEERNGARVPTPDPKDQMGDPDADSPAMQDAHNRRSPGNITES